MVPRCRFWLSSARRRPTFRATRPGCRCWPSRSLTSVPGPRAVTSSPSRDQLGVDQVGRQPGRLGELNCVFNLYPAAMCPAAWSYWPVFGSSSSGILLGSDVVSTFGVPPGGVVRRARSRRRPSGRRSSAAGGVFAGTFYGPALAPYSVVTADNVRRATTSLARMSGSAGTSGTGTGSWPHRQVRRWVHAAAGRYCRVLNLTTATGLISTQPGGLFEHRQDLGRHHKDRFAILPRADHRRLPALLLAAGEPVHYLWTNTVIRPTNTISPFVNPNLVPVSPLFQQVGPGVLRAAERGQRVGLPPARLHGRRGDPF